MNKRNSKAFPSKKTLNLVKKERNKNASTLTILAFVLAMLLIGVFAKYGVIDLYAKNAAIEAQVASNKMQLQQLQKLNEDYETVRLEYYRLFSSVDTGAAIDIMDVLDLVDTSVLKFAGVASATLQDNVLALELTNASLSDAAKIMETLKQSSMVYAVIPHMAVAPSTNKALSTVSMTVALLAPGETEPPSEDAAGDADVEGGDAQ